MDSYRIKIERITDYKIALMILNDETIASEIYEDGAEPYVPNLVDEYWIAATLDNYFLGCYRVHPMGAVCWQIHVRILPQYRKDLAAACSKRALLWCIDNIPDLQCVVCFVPEVHVNVLRHANSVGFHIEGCLKGSYKKNDKIIAQRILSIDRQSIEETRGKLCQQPQS